MEIDQIFSWPPTPTKWRALKQHILSLRVIAGRNVSVSKSSSGQIINSRATASTSLGDSPCAFGEVIPDGVGFAIRGGIVIAGDQTWYFDDITIDLGTDGVWLVSLDCDVIVNQDDDNELLLPGILTGTKPTSPTYTAFTGTEDYPDGTSPSAGAGTGVAILPIGKLTVASGIATLDRTGCGNFTVGHCAGTLSYSRT